MDINNITPVKELLSIEYVSLVGVLLAGIMMLVYYIKYVNKKLEEKDKIIYGFLEKFTELTTEIKGFLKGK
jgi:hypothetical protein